MKIVLLPGLDGTGNLFSPLIRSLSEFDCEVIALPETGSQDYHSMTKWVLERLPKDDFILVAESFSGPIGAALARESVENMKGIVFVATFLSAPRKVLVGLVRYLPLKLFSFLPPATYFYKLLFLGPNTSADIVDSFTSIIRALPAPLIRARLNSIYSLACTLELCHLPVVYIQASFDKLVPASKVKEFESRFSRIVIRTIEGPHFILQAKPIICAEAIAESAVLLTERSA